MALFSMTAAADALDDLLDNERRLILTGRIAALEKMSGDKERLLARLPGAVNDTATLERLRAKVARNQELLAACARGILAVRRRLEQLTGETPELRTYGRDGTHAALGPDGAGYNRRA